MKKSVFRSIVIASVLTMFTQTKMAAQTFSPPFTIQNTTNCDILVSWYLIDKSGGCTTICNSGIGVLVTAGGGIITLTAADYTSGTCTGTVCNIIVTFDSVVGGATGIGLSVDKTNPNDSISNIMDCHHVIRTYHMDWTPHSAGIH